MPFFFERVEGGLIKKGNPYTKSLLVPHKNKKAFIVEMSVYHVRHNGE